MTTRMIDLPPELDACVPQKIDSEKFESASAVMRAGLRALEREEREYDVKMAAMGAAIDEGYEGATFDAEELFDEVIAELGLHSE